jgi:hypothetical protein
MTNGLEMKKSPNYVLLIAEVYTGNTQSQIGSNRANYQKMIPITHKRQKVNREVPYLTG